ncbi:MAG: hypothetical protein EOP53_05050 [Sphingobacteriales bacterium]|nr:MAG: hypothetical protein EOP53_05050 [Sphingobacteriales bacterium]
MKLFIYLFFFFPLFAPAQLVKIDDKKIDPERSRIDSDIFRAILSASTDTKISIAANYERKLFKSFTLFVKAGPAFAREYDSTDVFGNKKYRFIFNMVGAAEVRCYFSLKRRTRLEKTTKNFTACYLGIEEVLRSRPIAVINRSGEEDIVGNHATFINIGYQHQSRQTYYQAFFGTRLPGNVYSKAVDVFDLLHAGISIGIVF